MSLFDKIAVTVDAVAIVFFVVILILYCTKRLR